ncbi:mannose-6-phosphate isomerase [Candidatus Epulonipiscium fishelsonii]|uniref:Mannose-6-phosphate isomerase n=1 Tax=Candidatus Epulonipiscium fishelsonii TaxID=77094 RepID=A0ACC8XGG1_9FIRM|nr:mannose-6-phosphate isomerase [Epulopiscium sp. SCG-B05WGA-EpuloA1]ONI42556.1 mannose-6-phosphate isomerase [Epulopiscium sp. SCG-B11WGA-EpuloA1]
MSYLNFKSQYNPFPKITVSGYSSADLFKGYDKIVNELKYNLREKKVLTIEMYPGVRYEEVMEGIINPLNPTLIINSDDCAMTVKEMNSVLDKYITDDRVFGYMTMHSLKDFFIEEEIFKCREKIAHTDGLVIVYGTGASIIHEGDLLIYADLARWEIQQRYRSNEIGNWRDDNYTEEILRKYKRGYFIEWRMADKLKKQLYNKIDYLLDTNIQNTPKMVTGKAFLDGLNFASTNPFRLVPYFDKGVWGGQWMKEVCNLDQNSENYAWSFDGVPEENSIYLQYGDEFIEVPSINIVFREPKNLLGPNVYARYGAEFPIRFDFLDTMQGGNLSLQVHPITSYIQEQFGMHYTQDESYYMLDTGEDAVVYLGFKEGIDKEEFIEALNKSQADGTPFDDSKYINKIAAKKHDHFLIPAGTIHCSGSNSMVLEISATPYIFTFKLWDWGRVNFDGKPRPIHVNHGKEVLDFDRDTKWVYENLVNHFENITENENVKIEKTGLHGTQAIETKRYTIKNEIIIETQGSVNVLNLIEGKEALVESLDNSFNPLVVHYAETFIVPESCKIYKIKPIDKEEIKIIRAIVKN